MNYKKVLVVGLAIALAACATATVHDDVISERAAERLSEFTFTGETENCLSLTSIQSMTALDDRNFLVRATGGKYYLNQVSNRCGGASRAGNRLQYELSGSQLCRNQIVKIVDNSLGFTVGSCGLSSFEELEKIDS